MSGPLATGGVSGGGTTTVVKISEPQCDSVDKKILCQAMCTCDKNPNIGIDGRKLKQNCVVKEMKVYEDALKSLPGYNNTPYMMEVNYNMTTRPPTPIMDSTILNKVHPYLPGYIQKYMPDFVSRVLI